MGSESSRSVFSRPVTLATISCSCTVPNFGSTWVISPKPGWPGPSSNRTGTVPTFKLSLTSRAPFDPRSTNAVPSVGCPANGNSSWTVKIRTRTPRSRSTVVSPGRMKVVSERFVSRAKPCISASLSPRPSVMTARALPSRGWELKTSTCTIASFLGFVMRFLPNYGMIGRRLGSIIAV